MSELLNNATWRPVWRVLLGVMLITISWLAFTPNPPPAADLGWDKANHFAAFGSLAFVALQCLRPARARRWSVLAGLLAYGIFIELVQSQIPGRDAEALDVLADMIGAVGGTAVHAAVMWIAARLLATRAPLAH